MMVQAPEEEGEIPTDTQDTPILTQPSPSQPQRKHKSRRKQRKETEVPHTKPQTEEHIPTPSHDSLPSEQIKTNQATEIEKLKQRVKKLEGKKKKRTHGLKRLYKVGLTARVKSSEEKEGLGDKEDASKQERIAEIDANEDLSLINETAQDQGRMNNEDLFRVIDLDGDEVIMDVTAGENVEQDAIIAKKQVSDAESVKGITAATTSQISKDDVTLAQTLIEIKAAKPKARGVVRKLEAQMKAEMEEEERIERDEDEANIAVIEEWDDVQATIDDDRQLSEQLQTQEREQLSIEERSKLLAELIESRKKYFAAKRVEEIRNKPPTNAQQKSHMCTYMKNMDGYKQNNFKVKSFDRIKKMFDKVYKRVNTFVAMDSEVMEGSKKTQADVTEGSSKRAGDEIEQESAKRQRLEKENDIAELKRCLKIVPEDDDDVTIKKLRLLRDEDRKYAK
uniref:Uncharacterized protein n=1 Tax=Tanacetum cinerariifolium TaxID=118510 RepID=A0A6L2L416_TANCI|nr:hypothetical protein [Tanacetum cinerariifolium]